jgi:hypothetical protein
VLSKTREGPKAVEFAHLGLTSPQRGPPTPGYLTVFRQSKPPCIRATMRRCAGTGCRMGRSRATGG